MPFVETAAERNSVWQWADQAQVSTSFPQLRAGAEKTPDRRAGADLEDADLDERPTRKRGTRGKGATRTPESRSKRSPRRQRSRPTATAPLFIRATSTSRGSTTMPSSGTRCTARACGTRSTRGGRTIRRTRRPRGTPTCHASCAGPPLLLGRIGRAARSRTTRATRRAASSRRAAASRRSARARRETQ